MRGQVNKSIALESKEISESILNSAPFEHLIKAQNKLPRKSQFEDWL